MSRRRKRTDTGSPAAADAGAATPTNAPADGGEAAAVAPAPVPAADTAAEVGSAAADGEAGSFADVLTEAGGRPTEGDLLGGASPHSDPEVFFREAEVDEGGAEVVIHDADAEDAAEARAAEWGAAGEDAEDDGEVAPGGARSMAELMSVIEALIFVSEEPLSPKALAEVLKEDRGWIEVAVVGGGTNNAFAVASGPMFR